MMGRLAKQPPGSSTAKTAKLKAAIKDGFYGSSVGSR